MFFFHIGLVFADGQAWISTRRVILKYLKSFGFGSRSMETYISEECTALVNHLKGSSQPVDVNEMFDVPVINTLWRLVAGKRFLHTHLNLFMILSTSLHRYKTNSLPAVCSYLC